MVVIVRYLLLALLAWTLSGPTQAQFNKQGFGFSKNLSGAAPTYTGVGNIQSGFDVWYGTRGYSAAYATGSNPAVNLRQSVNAHTCDVLVTTTGDLGNTSNCSTGGDNGQTVAAWTGNVGTASCTISGTTATCTGASATPTALDPISGSGVGAPCYVYSAGTFTGGAGTLTVPQTCGTVSVAVTMTFQVPVFVVTWYDQSGHSSNLTQATTGAQAQYLPVCQNSKPCVDFYSDSNNGVNSPTKFYSGSTITGSVAAPTFSAVIAEDFNYNSSFFNLDNTSTGHPVLLSRGSAFNVDMFGSGFGSASGVSVSQFVFFSVQAVAGTSGLINLNGSETANNPGAAPTGTTLGVGVGPSFYARVTEFGVLPSTMSSGNRTAVCHNQITYWGITGSC